MPRILGMFVAFIKVLYECGFSACTQAAQEFQSEIKTSTEAQAEVKSNTATPLEEPKVAPPATTISNSTSTSEKDSP
jgi:hypothetical protein